MDREEAKRLARRTFGPSGYVSEGLQMKNTLAPAVGVGFFEGGKLCIQGKGLTWEEAFTQAMSRRAEWQSRVPECPTPDESLRVSTAGVSKETSLEKEELTEEKLFQRRVRAKVLERWGNK